MLTEKHNWSIFIDQLISYPFPRLNKYIYNTTSVPNAHEHSARERRMIIKARGQEVSSVTYISKEYCFV